MTDNIRGVRGARTDARERMLDRLLELADREYDPRQIHVAVSAAKAAIDAIDSEQSPEQLIVGLLGSPAAALAWCEQMLPKLRAMCARDITMPELEGSKGPDDGKR